MSEREARTARAEDLLAELADPELRTWEATEKRLVELWSRSGSATADLLLKRGQDALDAEDYTTAIEHLTALTDHAPDFAEGWHARATAFYLIEEFGLALTDLQRALALNPNHFSALTGVGIVLEELGQPEAALAAMRRAQKLNPHRGNIRDSIRRLEYRLGETTL
ncbi:tetratricopeptide repeat protein [Halovulum marinum]|uniref:tetratricopeptide repeat protein n=1 Tax=Halovulum marinum TaxID=2662447 RepID=UPI0012B1B2C5|nr:tetratricopeptide repeat protein [Halovulum marinum]